MANKKRPRKKKNDPVEVADAVAEVANIFPTQESITTCLGVDLSNDLSDELSQLRFNM